MCATGVPGAVGPVRPLGRAALRALLGRAAVCAGGRRPAREISTREPEGSEWSISRHALVLPPPTGTATMPPTAHAHHSQALRPLRSPPHLWRLCPGLLFVSP